MKKLLSFIFLVILFSVSWGSVNMAFAESWKACADNPDYPWEDENYVDLCNNGTWGNQCASNCCIRVYYRERMIGGVYYQNAITHYKWLTPGCEACGKIAGMMETIVYKAEKMILATKATKDTTFKSSLGPKDLDNTYAFIKIFSYSKCFTDNNKTTQCDSTTIRCCTHLYRIDLTDPDTDIHDDDVDYYGDVEEEPSCPTNCFGFCFEDPFDPNPNNCDLHCDEGVAIAKHADVFIEVPGCCPITRINYHVRTSINCPTEYYDYILDSYEFDPNCLNNPLNCWNASVHAQVIQWLLRNGGLPLPSEGCIENVRMIQSPCWHVEVLDPNKYSAVPCDDSYCCWKRYKVCKVEGQQYPVYTILESSPNTFTCNYACQVMCLTGFRQPSIDAELKPDVSEKFECKSFASPNPVKGKTEISFSSNKTGMIKFALYDIKGNLVINSDLVKTSEKVSIPLDMTSYNNGLYLYQFYMDDELVCKGNLVVEK